MREQLIYIDRLSGQKCKEKIFAETWVRLLYGRSLFSHFLAYLTAKLPFFSIFYGFLQKRPFSRRKILPFVEKYDVNAEEIEGSLDQFRSFNDFFTRKLKKEARPIAPSDEVAVIPADGRFLFFPQINCADGYHVKGKLFSLEELLLDAPLAKRYKEGSLVLARLCPTDYHRFHFPCMTTPGVARPVNGSLYSVNPLALRRQISILAENKRVITELETEHFGTIAYIEVGATFVGTIHQTYLPGKLYEKGEEKGFFSFGGSTLILLFEKGKITFDDDLLMASRQKIEILCRMGQSMGKKGSDPRLS